MRIGIDNISTGESTRLSAPGGMRGYLCSLLSEFARQAPEHEFVLFTPRGVDELVETYPPNVQVVRLRGVPVNRVARAAYQQTALAAAVARARLDVFLATATVAPLLGATPVVLAVQFLQFYDLPQGYGPLRRAYLKALLPLSLRRARRAIIFTETARRDLVRYTGVAPDKVAVVPHGLPSEVWAAAEAVGPGGPGRIGLELTGGRPYILYVSATYGYKNHLRLIRAFAAFKRQTGLPHALLLVGAEVHVPYATLRREAEAAGVGADVIIAGRVKAAALLYLDAALAVVPTLYETFGYPILEALALGCPLVTSNLGSMAELAADAALLADPHDEASLAAALARALTDDDLRRRLVARGRERARAYTWARAAAATLDILAEAARA
jgi:glycosyltransferase involved in cell wall biosynthesis